MISSSRDDYLRVNVNPNLQAAPHLWLFAVYEPQASTIEFPRVRKMPGSEERLSGIQLSLNLQLLGLRDLPTLQSM